MIDLFNTKKIEALEDRIKKLEAMVNFEIEDTKINVYEEVAWGRGAPLFFSLNSRQKKTISASEAIRLLARHVGFKFSYVAGSDPKVELVKIEKVKK